MSEKEEEDRWAYLCQLADEDSLSYEELDNERRRLVASAQARILRTVLEKIDAALEAGMDPKEWLGRVAEKVEA